MTAKRMNTRLLSLLLALVLMISMVPAAFAEDVDMQGNTNTAGILELSVSPYVGGTSESNLSNNKYTSSFMSDIMLKENGVGIFCIFLLFVLYFTLSEKGAKP